MIINIGILHFITLGCIVFAIGVVGLLINRKNLIMVLLSIELMLLGVNINFVSLARYFNNIEGQIITIFVLTIAAAEAAIGLGIIVNYFRLKKNIDITQLTNIEG